LLQRNFSQLRHIVHLYKQRNHLIDISLLKYRFKATKETMGKGSNVQKAQQARERNQKKMGKTDEGK